jgi:hypothetical protein
LPSEFLWSIIRLWKIMGGMKDLMSNMRSPLRKIGFITLVIAALFALLTNLDEEHSPAVFAGETARAVSMTPEEETLAPGYGAHAFSFAITADTRYFAGPGQYDSPQYFRGAVEAVDKAGPPAFMVSPGDLDPPSGILWTITNTLGMTYTWYPVAGNHDLPGGGQELEPGANLAWLNAYDYGSVNPGPSGCPTTTYSVDYENAHLIMLNEYCDASGEVATDGDMPDHLYDWLVTDLAGTDKEHIFVFGHEPGFPQPDIDNGRSRHVGDSLDKYPANRDRFWALLASHRVVAYICGHTHNFSVTQVSGVWQIDAGHARGLGDTGAPSTVVLIHVADDQVWYEAYRDDANGGSYARTHSRLLRAPVRLHLPLIF